MFGLLKQFIKREISNSYFSKTVWLGEALSALINLTVYWFTAKAFTPNFTLGSTGHDYFTFLVTGEVVMAMPLVFMTAATQHVFQCARDGTYEIFITEAFAFSRSISLMCIATGLLSLLKTILFLSVAYLLFELGAPWNRWLEVFFLQLAFAPLLLGIGLMAAAIAVMTGRGGALLSHLAAILYLLSGTFFPTTVFPNWLKQGLDLVSPYNFLLDTSRRWLAAGWSDYEVPMTCLKALGWGGLVLTASLLALRGGFEYRRKTGNPLLVTK